MLTWGRAWQESVYGPGGWAHRPVGPAGHFRTSAHVPLFAEAIAELVLRVDAALGRPAELDLVDVGAGRGELLAGVLPLLPAEVRVRLRPVAVEVAGRPDQLPPEIDWVDQPPAAITGLVLANEWLDDVPLDCAARDPDGTLRSVLVDPHGHEQAGDPIGPEDAAWAARWWPDGGRVELGGPRDEAWSMILTRLQAGAAVAIDYGHLLPHRPPDGTLTGFRDGREMAPVPDGSMNLTAHVAVDAVAAAGIAAGARGSRLVSQRAALDSLGMTAPRPDRALAHTRPADYLAALQRRGLLAELREPGGLGGFHWLLQWRGIDGALLPGGAGAANQDPGADRGGEQERGAEGGAGQA